MAKYVVTGGCGFIGSHIVDNLITAGHEVVVIDNLSADAHEEFYFNPKAKYFHLDIAGHWLLRGSHQADETFENASGVFHLAAESRIQPCIQNPTQAYRTNVFGSVNIFETAKHYGIKRIVYSSTSAAYGNNPIPNNEFQKNDCLNFYSASKTAAEDAAHIYNREHGMEIITLRYFNVYGPREPMKGQYAPVVGIFLRQFENGEPLTIVGDGMQRRDFTHVYDVVRANILAMEVKCQPALLSGHINIGSGSNYSIDDLASMFPHGTRVHHMDERPGESLETLANNFAASHYLGWKPEKSLPHYMAKKIEAIQARKETTSP